jgi:hypothetical protein
MDGVTKSKSTFVVTDFEKFSAGVKDGKMVLSIEAHHTRSNRVVYFLNATLDEKSNRLYFALPKNQTFETLFEEKPKLVMRVDVDAAGVPVDEAFRSFEQSYKSFMQEHVEPLIKSVIKSDSTLKLANFCKSEGGNSKFTIIQLPKTIKPDQITRLREARGSQILICISYLFVLDEGEKGIAYYGATFEAGRYPFSLEPPKILMKRKVVESEESPKKISKEDKEPEIAEV